MGNYTMVLSKNSKIYNVQNDLNYIIPHPHPKITPKGLWVMFYTLFLYFPSFLFIHEHAFFPFLSKSHKAQNSKKMLQVWLSLSGGSYSQLQAQN